MASGHEAADQHSEVVRAELLRLSDAQVERADRIRTSARQTFVYVSSVFTVVQALAFSSFAASEVTTTEQRWVIGMALAAGLGVLAAGVLALIVERTKTVPDISPADVIGAADGATDDHPIEDHLVRLHYKAASERVGVVDGKRALLKGLNITAVIALALVFVEVAFSLVARWP